MSIGLDKNDRKILKILQDDSSISNLELSKRIGLSPSACLARTKALKESGVIKNYTIMVDEKKLGMETLAFVMVELSPVNRESLTSFLADIKRFPQIQECYVLSGDKDYLLKIVEKDMKSYRDFIMDNLMANPYVSNVETSVVMSVEKRSNSLVF